MTTDTFLRRTLPAALLLLCATAVVAQTEPRLLTLDDFGAIDSPGRPAISPDGERVAYTLDERIMIVPADGGEARAITAANGSAWSPRWSTDGMSLYFLSDRSGKSQLWKLPVDEFGEAEQLTDFEHGIGSTNLSPDESRVLLSFTDDQLREREEDEEPQPFVITRTQFKRDAGQGYITAGQLRHLYVYDIEAETLSQITSGEYEEGNADWSPDGETVVFVSDRDTSHVAYSNEIYTVAADNTDKGMSPVRLTNGSDSKGSPVYSPDGSQVAYLTAVDGVYGQSRLAVMPAAGGEARVLTADLDRWVSSIAFSDDGNFIYFNYATNGANHLARVRLRDGRIETLIDGEQVIRTFDIADNGDIVFLSRGRVSSADLYRLDGRRINRLTDTGSEFFAGVRLGDKRHVSYESTDGTIVEAFITTPPNYVEGQRYPAILNIHGGPVGQFSWGYDFSTQFFASRGYVVLEPNPRGSNGRGQDFINAIFRTWGVTDLPDVLGAVDYAVEAGIADPERLAVTGFSYGGYLTNVTITETGRFKAAASGAGHSLIEANVGHDIYQKWYIWELGNPSEHRDRYDLLSPLLRADRVTTPTIFLGGRIDWNVPILNAELFYQALRHRGIDSQLVVYPDAHHGGWPEAFDKDYLQRIVDWFDHYLAAD